MSKRHRLSIMAAVLMATMWGLPLQSYAASPEQRCTELGANCVSSEPFQMTAFSLFSDFGWNPNDSTTKEASGESPSAPGYVISRTPGGSVLVGSDSSVLAALPSGHSVQRYMRGPEGMTGIFEMNQLVDGSFPRNRVAVRWYIYHSSNYVFAQSGGCTNSAKWFTAYPGAGQWDTPSGINGSPLIYSIQATIGGITNPDCCNWGPVGVSGGLGGITLAKWYRYEVIITGWTNTSNFSTRFQAYRKNVTDNGPEQKIIDTFEACPTNCQSSGPNWPGGLMRMSSGTLNRLEINFFRAGSCGGWKALSHMMVAAWSTDAGQRIGAASEVESGAGSSPPAAPATLRITKLMQRLWGALWSTPPAFAR